jgi:hypothetical protein
MPQHTSFGMATDIDSKALNVSASGDTTLIAAVAGRRVIVFQLSLVCAGAVTVTWKSTAGTALSGPCAFAANGGITKAFSPEGQFVTKAGEGLVINLGGAVQVGGDFVYGLI